MAITSKQNVSARASVGIDFGKNVFHIVGFDTDGKIVLRRKMATASICFPLLRPAAFRLPSS